jgi:hypothetical protein
MAATRMRCYRRSISPSIKEGEFLMVVWGEFLMVVWDASQLPSVRKAISEDEEGGRRLLLVEIMSARWDWYFRLPPEDGKVVWAALETPGPFLAAA